MKKDTTTTPTTKPPLEQQEIPGMPPPLQQEPPKAKGLIVVKHIHDGSGKKLSKHIVSVDSTNDIEAYEIAIKLERVLNILEKKRYDVIYKHVTI